METNRFTETDSDEDNSEFSYAKSDVIRPLTREGSVMTSHKGSQRGRASMHNINEDDNGVIRVNVGLSDPASSFKNKRGEVEEAADTDDGNDHVSDLHGSLLGSIDKVARLLHKDSTSLISQVSEGEDFYAEPVSVQHVSKGTIRLHGQEAQSDSSSLKSGGKLETQQAQTEKIRPAYSFKTNVDNTVPPRSPYRPNSEILYTNIFAKELRKDKNHHRKHSSMTITDDLDRLMESALSLKFQDDDKLNPRNLLLQQLQGDKEVRPESMERQKIGRPERYPEMRQAEKQREISEEKKQRIRSSGPSSPIESKLADYSSPRSLKRYLNTPTVALLQFQSQHGSPRPPSSPVPSYPKNHRYSQEFHQSPQEKNFSHKSVVGEGQSPKEQFNKEFTREIQPPISVPREDQTEESPEELRAKPNRYQNISNIYLTDNPFALDENLPKGISHKSKPLIESDKVSLYSHETFQTADFNRQFSKRRSPSQGLPPRPSPDNVERARQISSQLAESDDSKPLLAEAEVPSAPKGKGSSSDEAKISQPVDDADKNSDYVNIPTDVSDEGEEQKKASTVNIPGGMQPEYVNDEDFYDIESPVLVHRPSQAKSVKDAMHHLKSTKKHTKKGERSRKSRSHSSNPQLRPFSYSTLISLLESMNGTIIGEEFSQLNLPVKEKQLIEKIVDSLSRLTLDMVIDHKRYEIGIQRLELALRALEGFI